MSRDEGFLSRWSRRKHDSRNADGEAPASPAADTGNAAVHPPTAGGAGASTDASQAGASTSDPSAPIPSPSAASRPIAPSSQRSADELPLELPPIGSLTPQSDFRPFMQAGVDASTRNAALAQLFRDPHFNVMDGLDVYIDDYNKTEPIPPAMLARLKQLHGIGLSDDEIERWSRDGELPIADSGDATARAVPADDAAQPGAQAAPTDDAGQPSAQAAASDDAGPPRAEGVSSDDPAQPTAQGASSDDDAAQSTSARVEPVDPTPAASVRVAHADIGNEGERRQGAADTMKSQERER